ncbi:mucin-binding protein [Streptococcus sp. DD12]|uniref:mucin-binding protein n=1 Tax=Streptococcus sp. DD12 TaxID=1777880 RepID=UPI00079A5D3C|nr:YSIRK-type signal peptide-containing protein [Streptococcus sp. DD12]KXT75839.1 hypothetical protein STRDD12_00951 [Streptococcus sp. DD12]
MTDKILKHDNKQRFSLRKAKTAVGVASVLVGLTFMGGQVSADSVTTSLPEGDTSASATPVETSQETDITPETTREEATTQEAQVDQTAGTSDSSQQETAPDTASTASAETSTSAQTSQQAVTSTANSAEKATSLTSSSQGLSATSQAQATISSPVQAEDKSAPAPALPASLSQETAKTDTRDNSVASPTTQAVNRSKRSLASSESSVAIWDEAEKSDRVTLNHGDNQQRQVAISLPTQLGDTITVTVPSIFTASTDRDATGTLYTVTTSTQAAEAGYVTSKGHYLTTYTYRVNTTASLSFTLNLTPAVSDWSFLKTGDNYALTVSQNGQSVGQVTYTIGQAASMGAVSLLNDSNQYANGNMMTGQKYAFGIQLANDGSRDGDQFAGQVTIAVPKGFVLDTSEQAGFGLVRDSQTIGDSAEAFHLLADGSGVTVSQAGGAGHPITMTFQTDKALLDKGSLIFWGTYQESLSAQDNHFSAKVAYYSTNAQGERSLAADLTTASDLVVAIPVTREAQANLTASFTNASDYVYLDHGQVDGPHQSDDKALDYGQSRGLMVFNEGNQAQTNVAIQLTLEPGSVLVDQSGTFALGIVTTSENEPGDIVATLTDGRRVTLATAVRHRSNQNATVVAITEEQIAQGVARDGSNIGGLSLHYRVIQAGSKVQVTFSKNALLAAASSKKAGDKALYSYSVSSDQSANQSDVLQLTIAEPVQTRVQFTGVVEDFKNTSYQPTSDEGGNRAQITYNFRNSVSGATTTATSYLVTVPRGFDVVSVDDLALYKDETLYEQGSITDLGRVGLSGERMFRIDLAETPSYQHPIYLKSKTSYQRPVQLVADRDQLPATYTYRYGNYHDNSAQSLIMAIDQLGLYADNAFYDKETLTLKDGSSYAVILSGTGWYPDFQEAHYQFTYPSAYGQLNAVKSSDEERYSGAWSSGKPTENVATNNYSQGHEVADTSGTIRLVTLLTDKSSSNYSYNVINLPSQAAGDKADLRLTGPGEVSLSGDLANGTLYYAMTPLASPQQALTEADLSAYVLADQVTDWSQVRSVLLKSNLMRPGATAVAYLPYVVTGMADGQGQVDVDVVTYFTGDHGGNTYQASQVNKVAIQRYVGVITKWQKEETAGRYTDLQEASTLVLASGQPYATSGLSAASIPASYHLESAPSNATGIAPTKDVTVTYRYVKDIQQALVTIYDATEGRMMSNLLFEGKSGEAIDFAQANAVLKGALASGYVIDPTRGDSKDGQMLPASYDWNTEQQQAFVVYLLHTYVTSQDKRQIVRDIRLHDLDGQVYTTRQSAEISRRKQSDNVTNEVTYGPWSTDIWADYQTPERPGYTPTPATVSAQTVTADQADVVVDISYSANKQQARVDFIDAETKQVLETVSLTGLSDQPSDYDPAKTIAAFEGKGYRLLTSNFPEAGLVFDHEDGQDQVYLISFNHGFVDGSESKEVNSTVRYLDKDGQSLLADHVQTATWTRSTRTDQVTGQVTYGDWASDKAQFQAVKTPVVIGYLADVAAVPETAVTLADQTQVVRYQALGRIIPVRRWGEAIPGADRPFYTNDPEDATKVLETQTPEVDGFTATVASLLPGDPLVDTPVVYTRETSRTIYWEEGSTISWTEYYASRQGRRMRMTGGEWTTYWTRRNQGQTTYATRAVVLPRTGDSQTTGAALLGIGLMGLGLLGASPGKKKEVD